MVEAQDVAVQSVTRVIVRVDPNRLRHWHVRLIERLSKRRDLQVGVELAAVEDGIPSALLLLFALERIVYGLPGDDAVVGATISDLAPFLAVRPQREDLILDLTASDSHGQARTWQLK